MKDTVYIVFNRHSVDRMTKREPGLARGEKMVLVDIEAPDSLWDPLPRLHARLEVASGHSQDPATIVLDPHDSPTHSKGDFGQRHMNKLAAELMEKALNSTDKGMKEMALNALAICRQAGVEVRIEVPEVEPSE